MNQIELFDHLLPAYQEAGQLSNRDLYQALADRAGVSASIFDARAPIGRAGQLHSPLKRRVRWWQQSLKELGLLEGAGARGQWRITAQGKSKLTPSVGGRVMLGFSTNLGIALWAKAESAFPLLSEPIHLCLTSLPYVLRQPRAYGGVPEDEYCEWALRLLEPIVKQLAPGASIALNLGNDCFVPGTPARSLYKERLLLRLVDDLGLHCMDSLIWENPSRPPGPCQWSSGTRQQLNGTYEPIYWLTNDPGRCFANNRRVLQPHTQKHLALVARGGEQRCASYGDGAHRITPGAYGVATPGRIPRNIIRMSHVCADKREVARLARAAGLPVHGATMPLALAKFIIEFLTERDQLVVDPCAGWFRTARAAELTGRRWLATEMMAEYVLGAGLGMREAVGFEAFGGLAA